MGNCIKDRKAPITLFDIQELQKLNETFDYYCDLEPETRKRRKLSQANFEEIFIENPEFGIKLFRLLEVYGKCKKYIAREALFTILEVLLKDSCSCSELKNFEKFEFMTLISLQQVNFLQEKEELNKLRVTYLDSIQILNDLLRIRISGSRCEQVNEKAPKALLDAVFRNESGLIEWFELVRILKNRMKGSSLAIKSYFQHKFMRKTMPTIFPSLSTQSYLLNDDFVFQLQMSTFHTKMRGAIKLELLYSSVVHHGGFDQLVQSLIESELPTVMLFQHEEQYQALQDKSSITRSNIFGAISNQRWFDSAQPQGDNNDCLFQLYPNFVVYNAKKQKNSLKNYCYLNTKDRSKPLGIGFGCEDGKYRIWFDKIMNQSYCNSEDSTYESGDLVSKHIKKLQINLVEVWAIVHPTHIEDPDSTMNLNNVPMEQTLDLQQEAESNADYYWVKQKEKPVEVNANFYWMTGQQTGLTKSGPQMTKTPINPTLSTSTKLKIEQLVGTKPIENDYSYVAEQTNITTSLRRSKMQRPVLDFVDKPARKSYAYETQPEPTAYAQEITRKSYNYQPPSQIQDYSSPILKHETFGTNIEKTVTVPTRARDEPRGRKTVDQIIRNYESRTSTRKSKHD